jgi:hypothetical protein
MKKQNKLIAIVVMLMQKNYISIIDVIEYMQIIQGKKLQHVLPQLKTKLRAELKSINKDKLNSKLRPISNEIKSLSYKGNIISDGYYNFEYRFFKDGFFIYSTF